VKYERKRQWKKRLKQSWLERKEKNLERISVALGPVVAPDVSRDPNPPISARMIQRNGRCRELSVTAFNKKWRVKDPSQAQAPIRLTRNDLYSYY
jgi:hypothetical protein